MLEKSCCWYKFTISDHYTCTQYVYSRFVTLSHFSHRKEDPIFCKITKAIKLTVRNNVLEYNRVITNVGGAYNPTDCVFSAPIDGYYVFSWSTSQYYSEHTYSAITNNGVDLLNESVYAHYNNDAAESTSQTITIRLVKGDDHEVWVKFTKGQYPYVAGDAFDGVYTGYKL